MTIKKEFIKRQIGGDTILIPMGEAVYDFNGLFALNELGSFLWDLLPETDDESQLVAAVLREYEAEEEEVRRDVAEFLERLREMGIL